MILRLAARLIAALAAILILIPLSAVRAEGFSGGIEDTFGPRFGADPHQGPHVPVPQLDRTKFRKGRIQGYFPFLIVACVFC
jgi:hypothetical protein